MKKLRVNPRADLDIVRHYVSLLGRNPDAADRFRKAVREAWRQIRQSPRSFATVGVSDITDREIRFCRPRGFDAYLILFQVTDDGPIVLRVLHRGEDVASALRGG